MNKKNLRIFCLGLLALCLAMASEGWADTTEWNGDVDTNWHNGDNWSGGIPDSFFDVFINTGDDGVISNPPPYNPNISSNSAEAQNLTIGESSGQFGHLSINNDLAVGGGGGGGVLTVGGTYDTSSSVNHNAGTVTADTLILGRDSAPDPPDNQVNFYHMGGGVLQVNTALVGDGGTGYLAPQAGTTINVAGDLILGNQSTGSGMFDKQGGELQVDGNLYVGKEGFGNFWHDGGNTTVNQNLILGDAATGGGYLALSGDSLTVLGSMTVGNYGYGNVDHFSGTLNVAGRLSLGANNYGEYHLSGSGFLQADSIRIYNGTFEQTDGQVNVTWEFDVFSGTVNHSGGTATAKFMTLWGGTTYTLSDTAQLNLIDLWIQEGGTFDQQGGTLQGYDGNPHLENYRVLGGTVQQSGGEANVNLLALGQGALNPGSYELTGGTLNAQQVVVGGYQDGSNDYGIGALTVDNPNGYLPGDPGYPTLTADTMTVGHTAAREPYDDGNYLYHGLVTQNDGQVTVNGDLVLGQNGDTHSFGPAIGVYELNDGSLSVGNNEYIGYDGSGTFTQNGGTHTVGWGLALGRNAGSSGTYNLNDGSLSAGRERIGREGAGTFTQSGGTHTVTSSDGLILGVLATGTGYYFQYNGATNVNSSLIVGAEGFGRYELYQGTLNVGGAFVVGQSGDQWSSAQLGDPYNPAAISTTTVAGNMIVGEYATGLSVVELYQGSSLTVGQPGAETTLYIGKEAGSWGNFNQQGGDLTVYGNLVIGENSIPSSQSNVFAQANLYYDWWPYAAGTTHVTGDMIVGNAGTGLVLHKLGSIQVDGALILGNQAGFFGEYRLNEPYPTDPADPNLYTGTLTVNSLIVGAEGTGLFQMGGGTLNTEYVKVGMASGSIGDFTQSGGTHTLNQIMVLGHEAGSQGTYTLQTGGTFNAQSITVGLRGTGNFNMVGGELTVNDVLSVSSAVPTDSGTGTFTQTGGSLSVTSALIIGTGAAGTGTYTMSKGTLTTKDLTVGSTGTGNVTGTFALNATEPTANVSVGGNFTINERGQFTAVSGATINMTGSNFYNNSTNPANVDMSGLRMFFSNFSASDTFEVAGIDFGASMNGFTNNFKNFSLGTLDLTGGATLELLDAVRNQGPDAEVLYVYNLILGDGATLDLNGFHLYYLNHTFGDNVHFLDGAPQIVPLPSTLLLLASGLGGLALMGRRRFSRSGK